MADDPSLFVSLGIKINVLTAGLAGGVVSAFVLRRSDPWAIMSSVVVGTLTAAYLAEPAASKLGTPEGASGFIVGLASMAICQGIMAAAARWRFGGESNAGSDQPPSR